MIRTGRPVFHIKAHWISFDGPDGIEYYQLDSKGNLLKKNGKVEFELRKKENNNEGCNQTEDNVDSLLFDSFPDFASDQLDITFDSDIFDFSLNDINFDCFL